MDNSGIPTGPTAAGWITRPEGVLALLVLGVLLLLFGRRLFWLLVALVGAAAALWAATRMLGLETGLPSLLAAAAAGLLGALLAVLVQRAAVAAVGFLAGLWATLLVVGAVTGPPSSPAAIPWMTPQTVQVGLAILGGVLGAAIAALLFEAALIVLSSLAGGLLVVTALGTDGTPAMALCFILATIGVLVQTRSRDSRRGHDEG